MEKWKRGGQAWKQELGHGNCPCAVVGRYLGPEGQSTSEPPCLGTERQVPQTETETAPSRFQLRTVSIWGFRVSCRVSGIRQGWATSDFWGGTGKLKPANPSPSSQHLLLRRVPLPRKHSTLVRGISQDHLQQFFSKHLSSLASRSLPTELGWELLLRKHSPPDRRGWELGQRTCTPRKNKGGPWYRAGPARCRVQGIRFWAWALLDVSWDCRAGGPQANGGLLLSSTLV